MFSAPSIFLHWFLMDKNLKIPGMGSSSVTHQYARYQFVLGACRQDVDSSLINASSRDPFSFLLSASLQPEGASLLAEGLRLRGGGQGSVLPARL